MRRRVLATAWATAFWAGLATTSTQAADLIWEVESPFRFFKPTRSFALHEAAFNAARGDPSAPLPADIVWRTERRLLIESGERSSENGAARNDGED